MYPTNATRRNHFSTCVLHFPIFHKDYEISLICFSYFVPGRELWHWRRGWGLGGGGTSWDPKHLQNANCTHFWDNFPKRKHLWNMFIYTENDAESDTRIRTNNLNTPEVQTYISNNRSSLNIQNQNKHFILLYIKFP